MREQGYDDKAIEFTKKLDIFKPLPQEENPNFYEDMDKAVKVFHADFAKIVEKYTEAITNFDNEGK